MTTSDTPFGVRLQAAMAEHGPLCAGIDPHRGLLESWGLTYDLAGLERRMEQAPMRIERLTHGSGVLEMLL